MWCIVSSTTQHGESGYSPFTKSLRPTLTYSAAAHWNVLVYIDQFSQGYSWTLSCFSFGPFFPLSTLYCYNQNREQEKGEDEWLSNSLSARVGVSAGGGGCTYADTLSVQPLYTTTIFFFFFLFFLVRFLLTFYAINRSLESHHQRGNHHGERLWRAHHPLRLNPTARNEKRRTERADATRAASAESWSAYRKN